MNGGAEDVDPGRYHIQLGPYAGEPGYVVKRVRRANRDNVITGGRVQDVARAPGLFKTFVSSAS